MSMVSWFLRFRGVNGFMCLVVSMDTWFHRFRSVNGLMVSKGSLVSMVSWFLQWLSQWSYCLIGFVVSMVSWFHRFRGLNGCMVL